MLYNIDWWDLYDQLVLDLHELMSYEYEMIFGDNWLMWAYVMLGNMTLYDIIQNKVPNNKFVVRSGFCMKEKR